MPGVTLREGRVKHAHVAGVGRLLGEQLSVIDHPGLMRGPAASRALMPSNSGGSLVRDTALGLGPVLLLCYGAPALCAAIGNPTQKT